MASSPQRRLRRRPRNTLKDPVGVYYDAERHVKDRAHELAEALDMPLAVFFEQVVQRIEIVDGRPVLDWPEDQQNRQQEALPLAG